MCVCLQMELNPDSPPAVPFLFARRLIIEKNEEDDEVATKVSDEVVTRDDKPAILQAHLRLNERSCLLFF